MRALAFLAAHMWPMLRKLRRMKSFIFFFFLGLENAAESSPGKTECSFPSLDPNSLHKRQNKGMQRIRAPRRARCLKAIFKTISAAIETLERESIFPLFAEVRRFSLESRLCFVWLSFIHCLGRRSLDNTRWISPLQYSSTLISMVPATRSLITQQGAAKSSRLQLAGEWKKKKKKKSRIPQQQCHPNRNSFKGTLFFFSFLILMWLFELYLTLLSLKYYMILFF